jgi:hypothetical protein
MTRGVPREVFNEMNISRGSMGVRVEVELMSSPTEIDEREMFASAGYLTNDMNSVAVSIPRYEANIIVAEFNVNKARQMDVVDGIAREFRIGVRNYGQCSISFAKAASRRTQQPKPRYTQKQGQYLAFIYYHTKLNRRPPAEAEMQRYFRTSPPAVHNMVLQLEKKGFIERKPGQPRSIRLLVPRVELPELE